MLHFRESRVVLVVLTSTASVGLYAIQLAVIYGLDVITTCSPHNTDLVRSYGAKHVFDYNDPKVIEKITQAAPDLQYIFDTIGTTTSSGLSSQAFGDREGSRRLCTVRPGKANTEHVTANTHVTDVLVWTAFLKDHSYGKFHWPVSTSLTVLIPVLSMIRPRKMTISWPASCSKIYPRGWSKARSSQTRLKFCLG